MTDVIYTSKKDAKKTHMLIIAFLVVFVFKLMLASLSEGLIGDMNLYQKWTQDFLRYGFRVYEMNQSIDYPPLYMILLSPFMLVVNRFQSITELGFDKVFLKAPSTIFDMLGGFFLYKLSYKSFSNFYKSILIAIIYMIHPAIMINSAGWGQTDSILIFFIVMGIMFAINKKPYVSALFVALSIILKPTSILFIPFYAIFFVRKLNFKQIIICTTIIFSILLLVSGAYQNYNIFEMYFNNFGQYQYASLHGFNIHTLLGGDLVFDSEYVSFLRISYKSFGYILFGLFYLGFSIVFFKKDIDKHIFLFMWIYITGLFILLPRMHERYIYFSVMLSFLALMNLSLRYNFEFYLLAALQSLLVFINQFMVLYFGNSQMQIIRESWIGGFEITMKFFSAVHMIVFTLLVFFSLKLLFRKQETTI